MLQQSHCPIVRFTGIVGTEFHEQESASIGQEFEIRCSPLVRMIRSGSGMSGWVRRFAMDSGVTFPFSLPALASSTICFTARIDMSEPRFVREWAGTVAALDAARRERFRGPPNPGGSAVTLGNINTLISLVNKLWGKKRIWITEYGWQTNPPDHFFGVSFARQAAYVRQSFAIARANPRIDMLIWFMLRDDTNLQIGWQSGLLTANGRKKPAFSAFARLPH